MGNQVKVFGFVMKIDQAQKVERTFGLDGKGSNVYTIKYELSKFTPWLSFG